MANRPGIVWGGRTPDDLASRMSAFADDLTASELEDIVEELAHDAADEIERKISAEDRVKTGAWLGSVSYETNVTSAQRVVGRFGYLNHPPRWALWQEYGTRGGQGNGSGIKPLHALVDAHKTFETNLEDQITGRIVHLAQHER